MRWCITWFDANGGLKFALGFNAIPIVTKLDERQRCMCFRLILINVKRLHCCVFSLWKSFLRLQAAVNNKHVVAVGETSVCFGIIGIDCDCLIEKVHSLL